MEIPLRHYLRLLAKYLKPQSRRSLLMGLLLLASIGLQLANPQVLRYFIDTATSKGSVPSLMIAAILFIAIALTNQGISILARYFSEKVAWTATNQLRTDLVATCLSGDVLFAGSIGRTDLVGGDGAAMTRFIDALTHSASSPFREPQFFTAFRDRVLPRLRTFPHARLWVIGAGDDAYSLAILLREADFYHRTRIYATDAGETAIERARKIYREIGQVPVTIHREINGFVLNRLQGALLAEAFRLVGEGYISAEDLDHTVKDGLGLRWSFLGPFETIELNAPGGIPDYCARYTGFYRDLASAAAGSDVYQSPNVDRVIAAWPHQAAPERIAALTQRRNERLAALAAHKAAQKDNS